MIRLIYVSRVGRTVRFEDAEAIARGAAARNTKNGVTGLLLYTPSHFIQVLEGEPTVVEATVTRIAADPRHEGLRIVSRTLIEERLFGLWAMSFRPLSRKLDRESLERLTPSAALELLLGASKSSPPPAHG